MAVGRRVRDLLGADDASRGDAVLDDERLAERFRELRRDQARYQVAGATGTRGDHDTHRLRGIGLRGAGQDPQNHGAAKQRAKHRPLSSKPGAARIRGLEHGATSA